MYRQRALPRQVSVSVAQCAFVFRQLRGLPLQSCGIPHPKTPLFASGYTAVSKLRTALKWRAKIEFFFFFLTAGADARVSLSNDKSYSYETISLEGRFVAGELKVRHPEISRGSLTSLPETEYYFPSLPWSKPSNYTHSTCSFSMGPSLSPQAYG